MKNDKFPLKPFFIAFYCIQAIFLLASEKKTHVVISSKFKACSYSHAHMHTHTHIDAAQLKLVI